MSVKKGVQDGVAVPVDLDEIASVAQRPINLRRTRSESVQLHEMVAIHQLSQAVALMTDPDAILNEVADAALAQFGADEVSILLPTADGSELRVAAIRGDRRQEILGERVPFSWGVAGWVARNRKGLQIDGEIDDPRFIPIVPRPDIHSAISMPMVVGGRFAGVLNVSTTRRRRFTRGQARALSILSSTAAAALEHARLHAEALESEGQARSIAQRLAAMNEFARAATSILDADSLYTMVLDHVARLIGCNWCSMAQYDGEHSRLRLVAIRGGNRLGLRVGSVLDTYNSGSGTVLETDSTYIVQDTREAPPRMKRELQLARQGVLARIIVPIKIGSSVWGTVGVGFGEVGAATEDRVQFLEGMAPHLAVAIHNAELYTQLHSAYDQLKRAQHQIVQQERMRALGQMASGIAHDFNNALVPVLGFTELLLTEQTAMGDPARVRRSLELIRTGAQDAASVVARLREFYRQREEGELFQPVNLNQVIENVVALTQPRWRDQALALGITIEVETDLDPSLPLIAGNEAELREALMNLVFNAVDALASQGTIGLRSRWMDGLVEVEVSDTGDGMSEYVREHCFEPLFSTKGEHGTGLGLSMVYGIIQRHEGTVEIISEPGAGTTVRLRLPVANGPVEDDTTQPALIDAQLRVLVVDDQPPVREVLSDYLSRDGHVVECAKSGSDAIRIFEATSFDLVVTDRGMPHMSGDELAQKLKTLSPATPIILLTGFGDLMRAAGQRPAGVDAVVAKPVEMAVLRNTIASLLSNKQEAPKGARRPRRLLRCVAS